MSNNNESKETEPISKEQVLQQCMDALNKILEKYSASNRHHTYGGMRTPYGKKWKKNDILSCTINFDKRSIEFALNNEPMGIAFKDIEIDRNIYMSLTLSSRTQCVLLYNDQIDIKDESKWEFEGNIDMNNNSERLKLLEKINNDASANVDELKEGDSILFINGDDIVEPKIERINLNSRKILVRLDTWKWISMDSPQLFPSKDVINAHFDKLNEDFTKLGVKLSAAADFPTATLRIPLNEIMDKDGNKITEFKYDVMIFSEKHCMQIGFSDGSFKPNSPGGDGCGDDDHSWAFDGNRIMKWGKKTEEEKKGKPEDDKYSLLKSDFVYDYKRDYANAIKRSLYFTKFEIYAAARWFLERHKQEDIYGEIKDEELKNEAVKYKDEGNELYKLKKYYSAIVAYDNAIWFASICEKFEDLYVYYSNRSISLSKVHEYDLALADAACCIKLNGRWSKGYLRQGYAYLKLHRFDESIAAYKLGIKLCDEKEHKLLKLAINTAKKYKQIMSKKEKEKLKINYVVVPEATEESTQKEIEEGEKKVDAIHIDYGKNIYSYKDLISFDTFGWKLQETKEDEQSANEDNKDSKENEDDDDDNVCMIWKCDNYPVLLRFQHFKNKECDIKKKPIDVNMFSIRHIQRDNLLKSGINSGLILSENMRILSQPKEIYGVEVLIKTQIMPQRSLSGYNYWIKIPLSDKEYFELRICTTYEGQTTGHRDTMMMMKISKQLNVNILQFMDMKVWQEDPYDALYTKGALMNLSERQIYDKYFPYHPLSILRTKLMQQFKDSVEIINPEQFAKMYKL